MMAKIGRNQACPCGSGKKYKHCCLPAKKASVPVPQKSIPTSLSAMVAKVQAAASEKKAQFYELGVFLFFTDTAGNAWMLELSESDALQIAQSGEALETPVQEDKNSISLNFSHTFALRNRRLHLRAYADQSESVLDDAPVMRISTAIRRLRKNYSRDVLDNLHMDPDEQQATDQPAS